MRAELPKTTPTTPNQGPTEPKEPTEHAAVARRAGLVTFGTLASRILGAVRDAVIAAWFTVAITDAFWMAFTIPNALRVLLGEGAISAAFVPVLTDVRHRKGTQHARMVFGGVLGAMMLLLGGVTALGIVGAELFVTAYASGFQEDPARFALTVNLTRTVFPYIFVMGIGAVVTGALYASKRFLAPAFAPVMLNIALIAAPLLLIPSMTSLGLSTAYALVIGALLGGVLQLLAQLPALYRSGLLSRPRWHPNHPDVRRVFVLMVPLIAGLGVYQLNIIGSRQLASYLPGAVTYLFYSQRLVEIPQGMFALAIASAALPSISETLAKGHPEEAKHLFRYALRLSLFVAIPSTVALAVLATPIVTVWLGRGAFDAHAVHETARALVFMALGIWAVAAVRTTVPMFHAYGDTKTPVRASAVNLVVFFSSGLLLMQPMQHAGLALASALASAAQITTLLFLLHRKAGPLHLSDVMRSVSKSILASVVMGVWLYASTRLGPPWAEAHLSFNALRLLVICVVGALLYFAATHVLKSPELQPITQYLGRKLRRLLRR